MVPSPSSASTTCCTVPGRRLKFITAGMISSYPLIPAADPLTSCRTKSVNAAGALVGGSNCVGGGCGGGGCGGGGASGYRVRACVRTGRAREHHRGQTRPLVY